MGDIFQRFIALIILILIAPLLLILFIIVKLTSKSPFIFKQKRWGKDKKPFDIYKIRTMVIEAENLKSKIQNLNEADGPVFKIAKDPRYTEFGHFLAHAGLDEVPQLWNIVRGEMAFVGPRPLPISEAKKISQKYDKRFSVLPGISSLWVIGGASHADFNRWMRQDLEYVNNKSFCYDFVIVIKTIGLLAKLTFKSIIKA